MRFNSSRIIIYTLIGSYLGIGYYLPYYCLVLPKQPRKTYSLSLV